MRPKIKVEARAVAGSRSVVDRRRGGNVLVALQAYAGEIGAREFVG